MGGLEKFSSGWAGEEFWQTVFAPGRGYLRRLTRISATPILCSALCNRFRNIAVSVTLTLMNVAAIFSRVLCRRIRSCRTANFRAVFFSEQFCRRGGRRTEAPPVTMLPKPSLALLIPLQRFNFSSSLSLGERVRVR